MDANAVRAGPLAEDFANGIGEPGDLADAVRHARDALGGEAEAVDRSLGEAVFLGGGDVFGICGENLRGAHDQLVRHGSEDGVLLVRIEAGQRPRCGARVAADGVDFLFECGHEEFSRDETRPCRLQYPDNNEREDFFPKAVSLLIMAKRVGVLCNVL